MVHAASQKVEQLDPELRVLFARLIGDRFGLRLSDRQAALLDDSVGDALSQSNCHSPWHLYRALTDGRLPHLLESIATRLTVGETHFFRIPAQIEALRHTILPQILCKRAGDRRLRIWTAGCSSGEEPYTLAILLRELLPPPHDWDVRIVATDLNLAALEVAKRAVYGEWSFRDTPAAVRDRYFRREGKHWRLIDSVRQGVEFTQANLAADPLATLSMSPDELDLILCRNVTIYFGADAIQRLYQQFTLSLSPGGWLVLGPSDPAPVSELLQPYYVPGAVLWCKQAGQRDPVPAVEAVSPPMAAASPVRLSSRRTPPSTATSSRVGRNQSKQILSLPLASQTCDRPQLAAQDRPMAREQAEALVHSGTLDTDVYLILGMLYLDEGNEQRAIETLRRAAFLEADNPIVHFGLGRAYRQLGHTERAQASFVHARRVLMTLSQSDSLSDADGLTVDDLEHAISLQLSGLRHMREA